MTGILLLDKPEGWTSHDAVAKARRIFGEKRIGHGGTLDPMATGVLPLFVGRATRAVEFIERADKEYVASLRLGVRTDTMDTTGTVLETKPCAVGEDELRAVLAGFVGRREQTPPMYSAKKYAGKKLYEYARAGKEVVTDVGRTGIFGYKPIDTLVLGVIPVGSAVVLQLPILV